MKCPNCGKEAINVNGKYVCLDCGVEITSTGSNSQAVSNLANETQQEEENQFQSSVTPQQAQPVVNREDNFLDDEPSISDEEIKRPVEEAFVNELKVSQEPSNTGSYDFTNNDNNQNQNNTVVESQQQNDSNNSSVVADFPNQISQEPSSDNLENQQENEIQQPEAEQQVSQQNEDFFQPNSFDIKNNSHEEIVSESQQQQESTTKEVPQTQSQESLNTQPELVTDNSSELPTENTQSTENLSENLQEVNDPVNPVGNTTLDSLLNKYNNPSPTDIDLNYQNNESSKIEENTLNLNANPTNGVDNVQPTAPGMSTQGTMLSQSNNNEIPSVESVFGNDPQNGTNDFNASNQGRRSSGRLWIIIAAISGGILLVGGVGLGLHYYFNSQKQEVQEEKLLTDIEASDLSGKVSKAMESAQNISVNFDESINFSELKSTEENKEEITTRTNSGYWEIDSDGNAYISNAINGKQNKRTYMNDDKKTYVYISDKNKYDEIDGFQIVNNPKMFKIEADERGSVLYSTNIETLTEMSNGEKEGVQYKKIKVKFNEEYLKELISMYDENLISMDYEEFNSDNLNVYVYIDSENRINEVSTSGSITIKSEMYNGIVTLNKKATYTYEQVMITNPTEQAQETSQQTKEEISVPAVVPEKPQASQQEEELKIDARG